MSAPSVQPWTREDYARDARAYRASLPLEHFMEATPQATQREITLASLNELKSRFAGMGYFNELLVQKRYRDVLERAVPDNMVVLGDPGTAYRGSYAIEYETCPVLLVLEYISRNDPEKDYDKNFEKYEGVFAFPYYLIFDPEVQSLLLYHLFDGRYVPVEETVRHRLPIAELDLEVALLDGWVRFWYRGELLPVPAELREQMARLREQMARLRQQMAKIEADKEGLVADKEKLQADKAGLVADKEKLQADHAAVVAQSTRLQTQIIERDDQLRQRDDQLKQRNDQLRQRDNQLKQRDDQLKQSNDQLKQSNDQLKQSNDQLEKEKRQADTLMDMLRSVVEAKARQAGREDILAQVLTETSAQQLQTWLVELS
jgi:hypothetical protein